MDVAPSEYMPAMEVRPNENAVPELDMPGDLGVFPFMDPLHVALQPHRSAALLVASHGVPCLLPL